MVLNVNHLNRPIKKTEIIRIYSSKTMSQSDVTQNDRAGTTGLSLHQSNHWATKNDWNQLFCNSEHDQKLLTTWGVLLTMKGKAADLSQVKNMCKLVNIPRSSDMLQLYRGNSSLCSWRSWLMPGGQWNTVTPKVWGHTVLIGRMGPWRSALMLALDLTLLANLFSLVSWSVYQIKRDRIHLPLAPYLGVKHLRKSGPMSGHWQTAEKMEQKLQWPQKNKRYTFCKIVCKSNSSSPQQAKTSNPWWE